MRGDIQPSVAQRLQQYSYHTTHKDGPVAEKMAMRL